MAAEGSPSFTLDKLHLTEGHAATDGKGRTGWAVWASPLPEQWPLHIPGI